MSAHPATTGRRDRLCRWLVAAAVLPFSSAPALADACSVLRSQLAGLSASAARAVGPANAERLRRQAKWGGCLDGGRGFFVIFRNPDCPRIMAQLNALRSGRSSRALIAADPQARAAQARILRAMANNGCSPTRTAKAGTNAPYGHLPILSRYRTLCVRTCDGYYFPISYSTSRRTLGFEEAACKSMYFGETAELYVLSPRAGAEEARSLKGEPYTMAPFAFLYRGTLNESCVAQLRTGLSELAKVMPAPKVAVRQKPAGAGAKRALSIATMPLPPARSAGSSDDPETAANRAGALTVAPARRPPLLAAGTVRKVGADYYYRSPPHPGLFAARFIDRPITPMELTGSAEAAERPGGDAVASRRARPPDERGIP